MDDETDAIVFQYIICIMCQRVSVVDKRVSVAFFDANPKCPECKGDIVPAEIVGDPPD